MLLAETHLRGERIVALFPCTGMDVSSDENGRIEIKRHYVSDIAVITTDEQGRFTLRRVDNAGNEILGVALDFKTFPQALRAARKSNGFG